MSSSRIFDNDNSGAEHNDTTRSTQLLVTVEAGGVDVFYMGISEPVAAGEGKTFTVDVDQPIRVVATQNSTSCDLAHVGDYNGRRRA